MPNNNNRMRLQQYNVQIYLICVMRRVDESAIPAFDMQIWISTRHFAFCILFVKYVCQVRDTRVLSQYIIEAITSY